MTTTTTTTTPAHASTGAAISGPMAGSVTAIRAARDGADLWGVADSLLSEVGKFDSHNGFLDVITRCEENGVQAYGVSALRQYRDTAASWPPASRFPGVTFSAHRAALPAADPVKVIASVVGIHGAKGATVARIKEAVQVATYGAAGVPVPAAQTTPASLSAAESWQLAAELYARVGKTSEKDVSVAMAGGNTPRQLDAISRVVAAALAAQKSANAKSAAWGKSNETPATPATPAAKPATPATPAAKPATPATPAAKPARRKVAPRGV